MNSLDNPLNRIGASVNILPLTTAPIILVTEVTQMIVFVILNEAKYLKIIQNRNLEILRSE